MESLGTILQIIVALGLLQVWLVGLPNKTPSRDANTGNLRGEFQAHDLPVGMRSWSTGTGIARTESFTGKPRSHFANQT